MISYFLSEITTKNGCDLIEKEPKFGSQIRSDYEHQYLESLFFQEDFAIFDLSDEDIPKRDEEQAQLYQTLQDTFNAFDKDGCGELQYPEYVESWKFLGQPGGMDEIKRSFDNVDVDGSGFVEFSEFSQSWEYLFSL